MACTKQKRENLTEKLIFRDIENLAKKHFLGKNLWALLDARVIEESHAH
jgi:hypothetical protein